MVKSENDFYENGSLPFSGTVVSGYPHQNVDNSEIYTANQVGVPEGDWYMKVRPSGGVSAEQIVEDAESAGLTAVIKEYEGEQSPRSRTNKTGETAVFVW